MTKTHNVSQNILYMSISYGIDNNKREEFEIDFDLNNIIAYGDLGTYSFGFIYKNKQDNMLNDIRNNTLNLLNHINIIDIASENIWDRHKSIENTIDRIEDFIRSNRQFDKKTNYFRYNYSDIWNNFNNFKQAFVENAKDIEVMNFLDYTIQYISNYNLDKFLTKDDICFLTEYIPIYTANLCKINELYETEIQPYIAERYNDIKEGLI